MAFKREMKFGPMSVGIVVGFNAATFLYSWFISEWMVYYGVPILAIISYFCISNYADMTEKDYPVLSCLRVHPVSFTGYYFDRIK